MTHHLNDKFVFYLNIALAAENSALERLQSRIQQTILEDAKAATTTSFRRDNRAAR